MAGSSSDKFEDSISLDGISKGIASMLPPSFNTDVNDDDDVDDGPKSSELYGNFTWVISKFSKIDKREVRSNAFEVAGYKWYILIYPQGCDVSNYLSLFLCVADHHKLYPGWNHMAQFTLCVVNRDPKKSKYSDALHRFWKKEHDWGWKKFMELSKLVDAGFSDDDTLVIKAQVQVIRERDNRPFRCLDTNYRKELVRVYSSDVEKMFRRFVEEKRARLRKLIKDKVRWSSFCNFWLEFDQKSRHRFSRVKSDILLKAVVKHLFIEKEVTSTLVMDMLYIGLKALKGQPNSNKVKGNCDAEESPIIPLVRIESDTFVLVDDVLQLIQRAVLEPLPLKHEKDPQNHTKDDDSRNDFWKDSIYNDQIQLAELGLRTIKITVLAYICSKIEVAGQEDLALKRQEELIREEEKEKAKAKAKPKPKPKRASEKRSRASK